MNFPPPSCHLDAAGSMMLIHDAVFYWSNKAPYKDGYLDIPGIQYPKYPKIISIIPLGQGHLSSLSLPLMLEPLPWMNWFMLIDFNWCFDMFCSSIFRLLYFFCVFCWDSFADELVAVARSAVLWAVSKASFDEWEPHCEGRRGTVHLLEPGAAFQALVSGLPFRKLT